MSGAMRELDASDYDLERFVEMFDEALTSDDPRVKNALRQLMMMVILTDEGDREAGARREGPLRRMQQDMRDMMRKMNRLEEEISRLQQVTSGLQRYGYQPAKPAEQWPKEWGGPTWAVGSGALPGGNIPPVTLDDLNIKINSVVGNKIPGEK